MTKAPSLSPELLRVFETIPDSYLILSPDFTILTASNTYLKATLKKREEIQGKSVFSVFPKNPTLPNTDTIEKLRHTLEWVLLHKQPQLLGIQRYDISLPEQPDNFLEKYWDASTSPVPDGEGNVQYIIHKLEDVTEQVIALKGLEQRKQKPSKGKGKQAITRAELVAARTEADLQREKLYNIFMQAPAMICIFEGPQHVFKLVNPPYQQLVGDRPLLGRPIAEAMPELAGQPIFGLLDRVYRTGVSVHAHEMKVQLDHENTGGLGHNYYNFTYQPISSLAGNIEGIMVFAYEVTDFVTSRQKVEQREQALQELNKELAAANKEISLTQKELQNLNQKLEEQVQMRTKELQLSKAETEAQRNQLHQLFMQAPAPIVILDGPDLVFELVNPAYQQIFPGRELLGKPLLKALPEVVASPVPDLLNKVYETGETIVAQELPLMLSRHEGAPPEEIYWTFIYQARRNEEGNVDGVLVFAHDVTDQVHARQQVEQTAEQLKLITDALPVLIGYLDKEEKYRFANKAYEAWFNQKPEELLGRPVREVVGEKAYQGVKVYIERALAGERLDFESRMPYREDFVKHIRTSYVPDFRDGKVAGFYTLVNDITEQVEARLYIEKREKQAQELAEELKAANEKLSASNQALRTLTQQQQRMVTLIENSTDFIGLATPDGKGIFINPAGLKLIGLEKGQVEELNFTDLFHEEDKAFVKEVMLPALADKDRWVGEFRLRHFKTGESITVHYDSFSIRDPSSGELLGLASIIIDITERKEQEAALQKLTRELAATNEDLSIANEQLTRTNVDLDNFIYAASHDLKAPIFNIEGLMRILVDTLPSHVIESQGLEGVTGMIEGSVERFKRTIEHLTDVTKLQKENNQDAVVVDLSEVIREVKLDLAQQLEAAKAQLDVNVAACPAIRFSEKNLRSVVYNLVSNAIKYRSPNRAPRVEINCHLEGDFVVLSVRDNGLGMDLRKGNKLFTMFGRLHDHVEGSGVGLYMVKRIVENADGRIEVESEVGVGSTFHVYIRQ
ncbi:PAS domain S-box protein [Pontibacter diazotrophicus]|uniref:histidine kinase n=1 Tax=Pontibacter diazotrophicus TaxID=1400979 RepID=A0A3D8LAU0_9BACT|nr:PAS domain-containing protein [Pontibacter diazotrophicus]RDV14508.1 PAS domain S-box protein [Pontibacter diazotrophicus]